jgi:hypothetical protein
VFSHSTPSSIDALIYGHLSLHLLLTMPDPLLRTTIVESHPRLAFYLHKCHEFFGPKNNMNPRSKEASGWANVARGWGVEPGKRMEDLIGVGGFIGGILGYAVWHSIRR